MSAGATTVLIAMMEAVKASGVLVRIHPPDFLRLVQRAEAPLVVRATGGVIRKHYQYLTSYKGFAFYTKSHEELPLPRTVELVTAKSIFIPS